MGYGVIGNTKVSGSFVLGSSPGIPANLLTEVAAPSYSGLVLRPLTAATPVQIRLGSPLGKKPGFFGSQAFLFISVSVGKPFRFYGAARTASKSHKCFEKPPLWWLLETQVASRREQK